MDTTTIAAPPAPAWMVLSELAACGQDNTLLIDAERLTQCVADRLRAHLPCPWGLVVLQTVGAAYTSVSWGLDDEQAALLRMRNGHVVEPLPSVIELRLEHAGSTGNVILGTGQQNASASLPPGFVTALRSQIELIFTLHWREAQRQSEHAQIDAASLLSLDLVGQFDLREVLRALIERALVLSGSQAAAIYMLAEDGQLDLMVSHGFSKDYSNLRLMTGEGLAGQVVLRRMSFTVDTYPAYEHRLSQFADEPWQYAIGVPLLVQDELIGVLVLLRGPAYARYSETDRHLIESFAKPAALIVRNAQLFTQQQQRARELFVLYENSKVVSSTLHIEPMLARVAENITLAMGADRCTLHLIDARESGILYEAASYSVDVNDASANLRYSANTYTLIAGLLRSGESVALEDRARTHRKDSTSEVLRFLGFRSALLVPLKHRERIVGLLNIGFTEHDHRFSQAEINLAQTLASQVATAVVNAQLYEVEQRRANELAIIQQINQRLGVDLDLDETLESIVEGAKALVTFRGVQICLYNQSDQSLEVALLAGLAADREPASYDLSNGLSGWVARYRRPLRLEDLRHAPVKPQITQLHDGTPVQSYLGLPILVGEQLVGTLELFSERQHQFTALDERLLVIIAGPAAQALVNARRYEQADEHLRSQLKQLVALQRVSRQLAATLSLDVILGFALDEVLRATPARQAFVALQAGDEEDLKVEDAKTGHVIGYIGLRDSGGDRGFRILAAAGYEPEDYGQMIGHSLQGWSGIATLALKTGEPALADELGADDRVGGIGPMVASALAMPIFYEDHIIGVMNLHSATPHAFNHDAIEFVRALTDQAALAIGNAQRYDEQRRQRELLLKRANMLNEVFGIGQALRADRSLEEVLEQIAFSIIETASFGSVMFSLIDPDDPTVMHAITGAGMPLADLERQRRAPLPLEMVQRLLDKRFRLGRCFFVPAELMRTISFGIEITSDALVEVADEHTYSASEWQLDDTLIVPLYSTRAQLVGLMTVDSPYNRQRPSRRSIEPLEIFADQAAIAIENANLLLEARAQTEQMTALYQVGAATVSTLDIDDLLEGVYSEIVAYMGMPSFFYVASYDSQTETTRFELFKEQGHLLAPHHKAAWPKSGWTGYVIDSNMPLHIHDYLVEHGQVPVPATQLGKQVRSWVGIPLRSHNQVIGVLSMQSFTPYAFNDRHIQFLSALANQLAVALENVRLFRERERRIDELDVINRLSRITNSTLDLEQMLNGIYEGLAGFLQVDAGYVYIYSERDLTNVAFNVDGDKREYIEHPEAPSERSLTARIIKNRQPLLFRDLREEAERSGVVPRRFGIMDRGSASWLGVPLAGRDGEVFGVLSVQSYTPNQYGERELAFVTTVASQVALGVQNARLFEATRRKVGELSTLLESARVLSSSLKPREVLDMLMEVVGRQLDVNTVALWTTGADGTLTPAAMLGIPAVAVSKLQVPIGAGLTGRVASTGQTLIVADVEEEGSSLYPEFNRQYHLCSFMGVPVTYQERTVGVLSVMTIQKRQFNRDEVTLLNGMADQAAIALENARLFEERERRITELTTLNQISRAINVTLQLDEMLVALHRGISEVLDASHSFIVLHDQSTNRVTMPILWINGEPVTNTAPIVAAKSPARTLSRLIIVQRRPLLLRTQQEIEALLPDGADSHSIAAWLGVPIIQGALVHGVIAIYSYSPYAYDQDDERFLTTVASQAATAIANARLFAERERRLREVSAMKDIGSAMTSTLELPNVLERLHAELGRVIDVSTSAIVLYDAQQGLITYPIAYDQGQPVQIAPISPRGLVGWVIENRRPLLVGSVEEGQQVWNNDQTFQIGLADHKEQSFLAVPITTGDDVLGVIDIQSYKQHAFDQDDLRFVSTVASQAAIALTNARLFQERGRRIDELETFNQIGKAFSAAKRLDEVVELIYRQTSRVLDTHNFYIALYDERRNELSFPIYYADGKQARPTSISAQNTLTSYIIKTRRPLVLQDANIGLQALGLGIRSAESLPRSWLGVPMVAADRVIGAICIQDTERDNIYSQDDIRLLSTIASWGATALENARLLAETQQSLADREMLYDFSREVAGSLDIAEVQQIVASSVVTLFQVEFCAVLLLDEHRHLVQPYMLDSVGEQIESQLLVPDIDLVTQLLFGHDRPLALNNLIEGLHKSALCGQLGLHSMLGAIIGTHEQPLGVLWLGSRQQRDWQEREVSLLSIVANLSGQALESARLFQSEQMRRRVADTLREVAQALTRLLPLDDILALILDQLSRVVPYDTASLMLREDTIVRMVATRGFVEPIKTVIDQLSFKLEEDENLALIVETRRPLVLDDAQSSPDFITIEGQTPIRGWIGAPLLIDDEVIGLLTADSSTFAAYTEEDAQLAFALASQAAQAIRNARLFEEVRAAKEELEQRVQERTMQLMEEKERLQAVHEITLQLTASLDLSEILEKTLALASRTVGAKRGSIMLRDTPGGALVCQAVLGGDGEVHITDIPITFDNGPGLVGWVMKHREPVCIPDVRMDVRWVYEEGRADEVRSVVAVPLTAQDGPLGVLILRSPQPDFFRESQVQLLVTIASEVAIVINNAKLYSYITDIATARAELLKQQKEENSKNQAILESLGEGVLVLNRQEQIVLFNRAAEQMLEIPAVHVIGQPLSFIGGYGDGDETRKRAARIYDGLSQGLNELMTQGKNHTRITELPSPTQSIALNFAAVIGPDSTPYGSVVVLRDITREIESDRAKRDFISSVSHELRTPLTSIKGYVDLLMYGTAGPLSEGQTSFLSVVKNNTKRLMELIDDILEIGRIDANKIELNYSQVDVPDIIHDVLQTMRAEFNRKSLGVKTELVEGLPPVIADKRRLTQVVMNLVSNATKYTYAGGDVAIRSFLNPAGMLEVDVEDNGVGISAEQQQNLFRRFYRADNPLRDEAGGTGLGLSIAKSFVELHGGEMWVRSEVGRGSTFSFIIPLGPTEKAPEDTEP